ncbi:ribonuclease H-like domain-containing protein [Tanacetum coccineum]
MSAGNFSSKTKNEFSQSVETASRFARDVVTATPVTGLYLMRKSLEVLRKFHCMILGGRSNQLSHVSSPLLSKPSRKAHLLEDKQIPSVGVFDEVFSIWKAFGGNTHDLGSFGEETDKTTNQNQDSSRFKVLEPGDGVTIYTQRRHTSPSNGVTTSFDGGVVKLLVEVPYDNRINDEYNALVKNGTWILVLRPTDANLVHSMWLFKHKFHADGTLSRYKARLVANGSSQQLSVDFDETFSLVVKLATIHTVLSLARSLYGMKQAPHAWFQRFAGYATRAEFSHSRCDSSLFIFTQGSQIIDSLHKEFDMTDLEALNYFLGIFAVRHSTGLFLSQKKYALDLLARAHMGTLELGLHLYASATTSLVGYTDADWVGCTSTHRSTSGYCVFLGDNLLSWSAKRRHTISRSSAEAEYRGVANVVAETAWLRNLLRELHSPLLTATLVYCDNVSVVYMSANSVQHERTNHIEIDIHFVRDMVKAGHVRVLHIPSRFQYADIFTKCLPSALFEDFRFSLSVHPPPAQTAGAY